MDGNIKDTPPVILVPAPQDRPRWDAVTKELAEARKLADGRKQAARADFDKWLSPATPDGMAPLVPTDGLRLARAAQRGAGDDAQPDGGRQAAGGPAGVGRRLGRRARRHEGLQVRPPARPWSWPTRATSRRTRASPTAPG